MLISYFPDTRESRLLGETYQSLENNCFMLISYYPNTQESRLLGEIHISLLKTIVKDIEDVAQATSNGLGSNQNKNSLSGVGHPQLVEVVIIIFPEIGLLLSCRNYTNNC